MSTIIVTVEGVLRKLTDGSRINEGVELVHRLSGEDIGNNTILYLTSGPAAETEAWLDEHDLARDMVFGAREDRVMQLRRIRHEWGYPISMVIEPDPDTAADLMAAGHTVLLFMHPAYSRPEWRPDHKFTVTSWDEIRSLAKENKSRAIDDVHAFGERL